MAYELMALSWKRTWQCGVPIVGPLRFCGIVAPMPNLAEAMAEELLAEPEFRAQMQALLRQAFKKALEGLLAE